MGIELDNVKIIDEKTLTVKDGVLQTVAQSSTTPTNYPVSNGFVNSVGQGFIPFHPAQAQYTTFSVSTNTITFKTDNGNQVFSPKGFSETFGTSSGFYGGVKLGKASSDANTPVLRWTIAVPLGYKATAVNFFTQSDHATNVANLRCTAQRNTAAFGASGNPFLVQDSSNFFEDLVIPGTNDSTLHTATMTLDTEFTGAISEFLSIYASCSTTTDLFLSGGSVLIEKV